MKRAALALAAVFAASYALAQQGAKEGVKGERKSGYHDMGPSLQKMQDDDTSNPGMLFVQKGAGLWRTAVGTVGKSCADCHAEGSMQGVAARYPAIPAGKAVPVDLEGRIDLCRTENQKADRLAPESEDLLALTAYVAQQSRGLPVSPPADPKLAPFRGEGEALYRLRQGQLNLSCAICHDENAGKKLAGIVIPQAHPTGYPIYRLEWQTLGSLKRRLRNCLVGIRAEPYAWESPQYVALELYLMDRARGLLLEGIGVRP
jgi:sulfur-oxidizing protein SoxA